jgi:hypothetical protein
MKMISSRVADSFTWAVNRTGADILYFPNAFYIYLAKVKVSVCEQKNLHIEVTGHQIKNSLNEIPVPYYETIFCYLKEC